MLRIDRFDKSGGQILGERVVLLSDIIPGSFIYTVPVDTAWVTLERPPPRHLKDPDLHYVYLVDCDIHSQWGLYKAVREANSPVTTSHRLYLDDLVV